MYSLWNPGSGRPGGTDPTTDIVSLHCFPSQRHCLAVFQGELRTFPSKCQSQTLHFRLYLLRIGFYHYHSQQRFQAA